MTKRHVAAFTLASGVMLAVLGVSVAPAGATIHPIVESFECANENAFEHHPLGDPADPPGQTPEAFSDHPGVTNHSDNSTLRGVLSANEHAVSAHLPPAAPISGTSAHKLDGKCGKVGQS